MKSSGIGGQAVLEGVMMKNKEKYAIAVRKPDHEIEVAIKEYRGLSDRYAFFRVPILRGVAAFVESMSIGTKSLTFSSSFYEEEEAQDTNPKKESFFTFLTLFLSIALAVGIFILLPLFLSSLISDKINSTILLGVIEGVIRVLLFVGYVVAISQMKDIKRFFQYHGAEHKTINCIEHGKELTVNNVRKQSKEHKRCGTSFMLFVMLVSIVLFMFIQVKEIWLRYVLRILLIPVVAGISYEIIRLAGRKDNLFIRIISAPGLWMQRLTTKEPEDDMIEVAIASVEAVFDWRAYLVENGRKVSKKSTKNNANANKKQKVNIAATVENKVSVKKEEIKQNDSNPSNPIDDETTAVSLDKLDKTLYPADEIAKQKHDTIKERAKVMKEQVISSSEIAVSLEPREEDEDDEILKALDRYLSFDKEEK